MIYFHPADHNPARIRKIDKEFAKKRYFKDIKFSIKIRRKSGISIIGLDDESKKKYQIYVPKNTCKRQFVYY